MGPAYFHAIWRPLSTAFRYGFRIYCWQPALMSSRNGTDIPLKIPLLLPLALSFNSDTTLAMHVPPHPVSKTLQCSTCLVLTALLSITVHMMGLPSDKSNFSVHTGFLY